jgi:hypothetical protein
VDRFREALRAALGADIEADLEAHIGQGRAVAIGADFLGPCFEGEWVERPRFELGFDRASFRERRVVGLVPGSAAERAGLREGAALEGWSVSLGRADLDVVLRVRGEDKAVRDLAYRPAAAEPMRLPQFRVKHLARADTACRIWAAR